MFPLLLAACGENASKIEVTKEQYEKSNPFTQSAAARKELVGASLQKAEGITGSTIQVESSEFDNQGRGIRMSESIENNRQGKKVSSSYELKAITHTDKSLNKSGSMLLDAEKGAAAINEDKTYYLSLPDTKSDLSHDAYFEAGVRYAAAVEEGKSEYSDGQTRIRLGYYSSGEIVVNFDYSRSWTAVPEENGNVLSVFTQTYYYEKAEGALRLTRYSHYYRHEAQSKADSFNLTASIVREYRYGNAVVEGEIKEDLPVYDKDYVSSTASTDFSFLPFLDVTSLFDDGVETLLVAAYGSPFHSTLGSIPNVNYTQQGFLHGKVGDRSGTYEVLLGRFDHII